MSRRVVRMNSISVTDVGVDYRTLFEHTPTSPHYVRSLTHGLRYEPYLGSSLNRFGMEGEPGPFQEKLDPCLW